jgi:uncharacterized protein
VTVEFEAATWSQIYLMLLHQACRIQSSGFKPDVLVGVSRGGWVPARILSDLLENGCLASVKVECYTAIGETAESPRLTQELTVDVAGKRVLVVDEVADTGRSLKLALQHIQNRNALQVKTAVLYQKPQSTQKPDFCEKTTARWVVFPWELKETVRKLTQANLANPAALKRELEKLSASGLPKRLIVRFQKETLEAGGC